MTTAIVSPESFLLFARPLPEPMILLSGDGGVLALNRAGEDRFGVGAQGWRGKTLADLVMDPPEEVARYLQLCSRSRQTVLGTISPRGADEVAHRAEGSLLRPKTEESAAVLMVRLISKQAATAEFIGLNLRIEDLGREIQRRKQAEREVREIAERLRTTLSSIGDGVITTDIDGRVTNINPVGEALTGWTKEAAAGVPLRQVFNVVNEQTRDPVENPADRALRMETVTGPANHTVLISRDGTERPIDDSAAPIRTSDGRIGGCVMVFRDVTERRREQSLLTYQSQVLEQVVRGGPLTDVLDALCLAIGRHVSRDAVATILLVDEGGTILRPAAGRRCPDAYSAAINPVRIGPASGSCGTAAYRREPVLVTDIAADPLWADYRHVALPHGLRSCWSLPILSSTGGVLGTFAVYLPSPGRPSDQDLGVMHFLSRTAGIAVERNHAETALRDSEERLRGIFTQTLVGIAEVDLTGRFVQVNQRYCEMVGRSVDELRELRMQDITHPDDLARNLPLFEKAVADGKPFIIEKRYVRPDGSFLWVSNSVANVRDGGGQPKHVVASSIDITERKRSEQQLDEALRFYHSSIDALSSHIAVLDEHGVILELNHAWRHFAEMNQFAGSSCGVGVNYIEVCATSSGECADGGSIAQGIRDVLDQRTPHFELEYPCHSPTEERWFLMRVTQFQSPGPQRVVVAHDNVTRRRAAEERLRRLTAELSEADRRKNEFLATLAHELRNPLAPMRNGLQLIELAKGDWARVEKARKLIDRQLHQMVRLVDDLMDVSRISTGKVQLRMERVTLASVLESAVETSRPLIDQMGHELTVTLPDRPLVMDVDPTRLAQVFLNLLNNAAKYSERNGHIWLTAEQQDGIVVSVKDAGIGIPPSQLPRVFEMFSQVDRSLEKSQGGLGIGLCLVKRLVELHGGRVEARSEGPGMGSEFVVRLPLVVESSAPPGEVRGLGDDKSALRILIVDDNRDSADSLALMLEMMGNETCTAYDGEEAVAGADEFRPDVILLDIGMPKLNGYEVCRRIRELEPGREIVIVAQTGWGQEEDRRRTEDAGFDHHLVKPVDPQALMTLLRSLSCRILGNTR